MESTSSYFSIIWKRKWIVLLTTLVTGLIVAIGTLQMPPTYTAEALLRLLPYGFDAVNYSELQYSTRLANSYIQVAESDLVMDRVRQNLGLTELPDYQLEILNNTDLIRLTVKANDPVLAQEVANEMSDVLIDQDQVAYQSVGQLAEEILQEELASLQTELDDLDAQYRELVAQVPVPTERIAQLSRQIDEKQSVYDRVLDTYTQARVSQALQTNVITIVQRATVPTEPSGPNLLINLLVGLGAGLVGGVALAFIFERGDDKLYSSKQAEAVTNLAVIGKIPRFEREQHGQLLNGHSIQSEAFRHLRTQIYSLVNNQNMKTLLMTSAEPEVGKSTVTANLAYSIAQSDRDVLVIDADMRRPKLHKLLNIPNDFGLSNVLAGEIPASEAIVKTDTPHLYVLPSGRSDDNPAELLSSGQMSQLLDELRERYAMILFDTPPFLAVADAAILAPLVDGVALVLMLTQSSEEAVSDTREQLANVNAHLVGVIINRADEDNSYRKYRYEYGPTEHSNHTDVMDVSPVRETRP